MRPAPLNGVMTVDSRRKEEKRLHKQQYVREVQPLEDGQVDLRQLMLLHFRKHAEKHCFFAFPADLLVRSGHFPPNYSKCTV